MSNFIQWKTGSKMTGSAEPVYKELESIRKRDGDISHTELLQPKDIANLINRAGFSVGISEWRPEKGGEYGRFELDTSEPMEEVG